MFAFTDGSCHPNPGPCGAGASVYLPYQTNSVNLKQPVSKHGSILLGELVAIKMVLDFILEKMHQKIQLNKVLILSDSQSSIGILTLGWEPTQPGFYRTQYPASYTHKSLGRTRQLTLPASAGTQMCLLCLSLKSQIPKLFRNDSGFPIFTGYL